ncbi:MAG: hypothetical protein WAT66_16680 [Actinomycetota bacterium]
MRRFFVGGAILALGLFLSACDLRAEISVNDDGSGTLGVAFVIEPEYIQLMQQANPTADPFDDMKADLADDPVEWKVQDITEGRLRGVHATFAFRSVDDLLDKVRKLNEDSGESPTGFEGFTLKRDGGGWVFSGTSTDVQSQTEDFPIPPEQLATLVKLQFRVTLPGKAGSHNANETTSSGGRTTFVWKPSVNERSVAFKAATKPGSTVPILPIGIGAAVIALAAVTGIMRSRKSAAPAEGVVAESDVAPAAPPPDDQTSP